MKFARLIILVFLTIFAVEVKAQTSDGNDEYRRCQSYDECMIVWGGCNDQAINKAYEKVFKPVSVCTASVPHDPKVLATCEDGKCVAVVINKGSDQ